MIAHILNKLLARPDTSAPLLIGATGGSGTRALHGALNEAGFFVGTRINHAGDAMDFEPFLDDFINPILQQTRALDYRPEDLPPETRDAARDAFSKALAHYVSDRPRGNTLWGWKNPRSMYVLPLIVEKCPKLHFLHLIRDGRDMALSDNQNQPNKHFEALFGEDYPGPSPLLSIRLWARANSQVADWGERTLGKRYMQIRFEDLCASPAETLLRVLTDGGLDKTVSERIGSAADKVIRTPDSSGRWQNLPEAEATELTEAASDALKRFGYLT